jgi:hypothetical protein
LKRKKEEVESAGNLEILAEAVTSQQDQSQNVPYQHKRQRSSARRKSL